MLWLAGNQIQYARLQHSDESADSSKLAECMQPALQLILDHIIMFIHVTSVPTAHYGTREPGECEEKGGKSSIHVESKSFPGFPDAPTIFNGTVHESPGMPRKKIARAASMWTP